MGTQVFDVTSEIRRQVGLIYDDATRFPWSDRKTYANWLAQTYFYVRRVSHVLAAAASRTSLDQMVLHEHFLKAIAEEKGHDLLVVNDIRGLGFSIGGFSEHAITKAFYQTLFHMIDTEGPVSLLGYFYSLEGMAGEKGEGIYNKVVEAHGDHATTFLREHVILDADHFADSLVVLDELTSTELDVVTESCQLATALYRHLLWAIAEGR